MLPAGCRLLGVPVSDEMTAILAAESDPNQQPPIIEFKLTVDGQEETRIVPCPTPVRTWFWILERYLHVVPNFSTEQMDELLTEIVLHIEDALSQATGLTKEQLAGLPAEMRGSICDRLAEQLGGELRNAAPFSITSLNQATDALARKCLMLRRRSAGTERPSPSSPSSESPGPK